MKFIPLVFILVALTTGCAKQLSDWVHADPANDPSTSVPTAGTLDSQGKIGVKLSPGALQGVGSNIGIRAGLTQRQFQGMSQGLGIQVGISRAPANF